MRNAILILFVFSLVACNGTGQTTTEKPKSTMNDSNKVVKTEEEWKKALSAEQYNVLREKGPEMPFSGKY